MRKGFTSANVRSVTAMHENNMNTIYANKNIVHELTHITNIIVWTTIYYIPFLPCRHPFRNTICNYRHLHVRFCHLFSRCGKRCKGEIMFCFLFIFMTCRNSFCVLSGIICPVQISVDIKELVGRLSPVVMLIKLPVWKNTCTFPVTRPHSLYLPGKNFTVEFCQYQKINLIC